MASGLYQAVYNQDIELAKSLLDSGVDPNDPSVTKGFFKILYIIELAVKICHENILQPPAVRLNMVKLLITHPCRPANPNLPNITGFRCQGSNNLPSDHISIGCNALIHFAIHHDDYDLALLLVTESRIKVDVDIAGYDGHRPLLRAIEKKNYNMVKLLLDAGANVYLPSNHSSMLQWTPFMFAVKEKKDLQMCKLLIDSGYDVNRPILDKYCSAVHLAVENDMNILKYLVETCRADIFAERQGNRQMLGKYCSVVHLAAANDITLLKYLVETCRADVFAESQGNRQVLGEVISSGKADTLEYLLHHGYQHRGNEIWWTGDDLLHHAVYNPACITVLLRWGLNNAVGKVCVLDMKYILKSLYRISCGKSSNFNNSVPAGAGSYIKFMKLLKQMYPQCLQERKFIESRPHLNSYSQEVQKFLMELYKERKNPSRLTILCRTKIFQQLGYNPIPKAENLPLPRCLISFVQFTDVEDLYVFV